MTPISGLPTSFAAKAHAAWHTGAGLVSGAFISMLLIEDVAMRTYDFSPLYRSTVGFDRLFDLLD